MSKPTFLVIGAQKSGTTWLYRFLQRHPEVFVPPGRKELMYFDVRARYRRMSFDDYLAYFEGSDGYAAVGELTPGMLWVSPEEPRWGPPERFRHRTPERVLEHLGADVRLVAILRNPVDRALSAFLHHRRKGRIDVDATIGSVLDRHGIVHQGMYGSHLARWREVFADRNFFIATYEALFADPAVRTALLSHIGVEPRDDEAFSRQRIHAGIGFIRRHGAVFDGEHRLIATPDDLVELRNAFTEDVIRLGERWGLDLSRWQADFSPVTS